MAIVQNLPCPKCQKMGHDSKGNHLLVFDDGAAYCGRAEYHKNGKPYFVDKGKKQSKFLKSKITGTINYTPAMFRELEEAGKLDDPDIRAVALGGMKEEFRYEVMTDDEQAEMEARWDAELKHFDKLSVRSLVKRGISGEYCKLYNVRVGLDSKGKVDRHYYPMYDAETGELTGAQCRNLPKDYRTGRLGRIWGKHKLFGMQTMKAVAKSKTRKDVLLIVGGHLDALAAQQMLTESREGTQWAGRLFHVWSVNKGEHCIQEIIDNLKQIRKFKKVIFAFDNDKDGQALNEKACRLVAQSVVLSYPDGMKDANQCLLEDREEEFVDAWFNADRPTTSKLKRMDELFDEAIADIDMGISWPWPTMDRLTYGIRLNNMYTIGGGSGVGKTEIAKEIIQHLIDYHKELVGIVFMEEKASYTARVLAGKWINKKLHLPKNDKPKGHPDWDAGRDYTTEQATDALKDMREKDRVIIADCDGDTHIDNIMGMIEELKAMGCKYIFIDNLTTISYDHDNTVKGIDEAMKRMGTYMQQEDVALFLLSHLSGVGDSRTPHENGGIVYQSDFRGSRSIAFWSTFMIGVERDTMAETEDEKCNTTIRCVKDRLTGMSTGNFFQLRGNTKTGRLLEPETHAQVRDVIKKRDKKKKKAKQAATTEY